MNKFVYNFIQASSSAAAAASALYWTLQFCLTPLNLSYFFILRYKNAKLFLTFKFSRFFSFFCWCWAGRTRLQMFNFAIKKIVRYAFTTMWLVFGIYPKQIDWGRAFCKICAKFSKNDVLQTVWDRPKRTEICDPMG